MIAREEEIFARALAINVVEDLTVLAAREAAKEIARVRDGASSTDLKAIVGVSAGSLLYLSLIEIALDAGMPVELVNKYVEHTIAEARAITRGRADA